MSWCQVLLAWPPSSIRHLQAAVRTLEIIERDRPDALFALIARRVQLVRLAALHRIPAAYELRDFAEAGGL